MNLQELRDRSRQYLRDTREKRFSDEELDSYLNEGVDRLRSYSALRDMPYLSEGVDVEVLPYEYHYILALYASARCFGVDNDFYQKQEKRNEFENMMMELIAKLESGEVEIGTVFVGNEYVIDSYHGRASSDEDDVIM